jgi:hypothetical protein
MRTLRNKPMFYLVRESKYKVVYGVGWFVLLYLLLLYFGEKIMFFSDTLFDPWKRWLNYIPVSLIILGSSVLTKMLLG